MRTRLQDLCAQALEKLADKVGRGIRYGEPPLVQVVHGIEVTQVIQAAQGMSNIVGTMELRWIATRELQERLGKPEARIGIEAQRQQEVERMKGLAAFEAEQLADEAAVRAWLLDFVGILE